MAELECLPLGVGQHGEGICLQVRLGPYWLLLDGGLKDLSRLFAIDDNIHWVGLLCSHAHSDHGRSIQALHAIAPDLPIFASEITARLLPLTWQERPLGEAEFCIPLSWGIPYQIQPDLMIQILPAGHLPGAASFLISYEAPDRTYTVLYTGDFFLSKSRLAEGLPLDYFRGLSPDVLIIEGSFGTAHHPHRRKQENQLVASIMQAIAANRSVLLPVTKLGMGQEILMLLRSHHQSTGKDIDIWVDRGIGMVCDQYVELLHYLPSAVQNFAQHQPLFWDRKVRPRIGHLEGADLETTKPCVVLVDEDTDWHTWLSTTSIDWLVFVHEDTKHRELPITNNSTRILWHQYLLADHSDVAGTTQLIHNLKPQHIIFVHGNPANLSDLANLDELSSRYHVHCASVGKKIDLPIGKSLQSMAARDEVSSSEFLSPYEGELAESDSTVMLSLPAEITEDPRWLNFADTGLVEAMWQGDHLLIRGISQRELLNAEIATSNIGIRSCGNCQFYKNQHCQNRESPLCWLRVSIDGYCPVFKPNP